MGALRDVEHEEKQLGLKSTGAKGAENEGCANSLTRISRDTHRTVEKNHINDT